MGPSTWFFPVQHKICNDLRGLIITLSFQSLLIYSLVSLSYITCFVQIWITLLFCNQQKINGQFAVFMMNLIRNPSHHHQLDFARKDDKPRGFKQFLHQKLGLQTFCHLQFVSQHDLYYTTIDLLVKFDPKNLHVIIKQKLTKDNNLVE